MATIIRLLPMQGAEYHYHIQVEADGLQRRVRENQTSGHVAGIVKRVRALKALSRYFWVSYVPQPLMRGDQARFCAALSTPWPPRRSPHHELQHVQKALCRLDIALIAGMMECDQYVVGKASRIARGRRIAGQTFGHPIWAPLLRSQTGPLP